MKLSAKEMTLTGLFTALTAIGAFISLPFGPVPITLQTLFVLLGGVVLGPKLGALSQIVYVILGLVGIPIFTGLSGGLQSIMKPSFGFLLGFIVAAYVVGTIVNFKLEFKRVLFATVVGTMITYLIGLPYMYFIMNRVLNMGLTFYEVFKLGCLMFIPGDVIKLTVASLVGIKLISITRIINSLTER
jgi:biotin transport system substrate-specific component